MTWTDDRSEMDAKLDAYLGGVPWESCGIAEIVDAMRATGYPDHADYFETFVPKEDSR